MRSSQARFITACQTTLVLGVVTAVLVPATTVVSLDVVSQPPAGTVVGTTVVPDPATVPTAEVPVAPVEPKVEEYAVEGAPAQAAPRRQQERRSAPVTPEPESHDSHEGHSHGLAEDVAPDEVVVATVKAPVSGYGAVGVTWDAEAGVSEGDIALQVRSRVGDEWGEWSELVFHDEHAPDAGSPDAELARAGTDALIVGDVDEVELRADAAEQLPEGLSLAVVDPGAAEETQEQAPEIAADPAAEGDAAEEDAAIELSAKKSAPKPTIYSRAQWGANESLRDKKSLRYGSISGGFVHHTVNANNYTADQVPGIIRSIYAYHTKSRGWSDLGYNFLVDRFGRIWEGRYGGVDKAVVGAHTLGYNDYSFAMSAIGNFETAKPSQAMVDAYSALMAWKLGLHGVSASSTKQKIGSRTFPAINGHRDAGSTACPGQHLYARLGDIRKGAAAIQAKGGSTPTPTPTPEPAPQPEYTAPVKQSNLVGTPHPDLVVRRKSDNRIFIIPTGGTSSLAAPKVVSGGWKGRGAFFVSADLTGDGRADVVSFKANGAGVVHAGNGNGGFAATGRAIRATRGHDVVVPYGDLNGDGRADLVARNVKSGKLFGFLRTAKGGFRKVALGRSVKSYVSLHAVGDITGDGRPDLIGRDKAGNAFTIRGTGTNALSTHTRTPGSWSGLTVAGGGDFNRDGRGDVLVRNAKGVIQVLPGRGDGSFGPALGPLGTRKNVVGQSVAPLTSAGVPDVVGRRGDKLVVMRNPGTYELGAPVSTGAVAGNIVQLINAGDFDGDGHGDVISVKSDGALQLRRGDGTGKLKTPVRIGTGFDKVANLEAVGDINRDGKPDLVGTVGGKTYFYAGKGTGKVAAGVAAPGLTGAVGRMQTSSVYDPTRYDWKVAISDAHLASGTDLLARDRANGYLYLFVSSSSGLTARRYLGDGMGAYDLAG